MNVLVNGDHMVIGADETVQGLVRSLVESDRGVAVSVDRAIVPHSMWSATMLHEGALVEVLVAAAGG